MQHVTGILKSNFENTVLRLEWIYDFSAFTQNFAWFFFACNMDCMSFVCQPNGMLRQHVISLRIILKKFIKLYIRTTFKWFWAQNHSAIYSKEHENIFTTSESPKTLLLLFLELIKFQAKYMLFKHFIQYWTNKFSF